MSSTPSRRSLSSLASGLALSFMFVGCAQGEPKFPAECDKFDNTSPSRPGPYSDVSQLTIKQLKDYSGWNKLREGLTRGDVKIDGLCPTRMTSPNQPPISFDRDTKSIDFSIPVINERGVPMSADQLLSEVKNDRLSYAGAIINRVAQMQGNLPNDNFINGTEGFHNIMLLNTALSAYAMSEYILYSVEATADDGKKVDLNTLYNNAPELVQEINDIHAKALVAKAQNRNLSDAERNAFHQQIFTTALKSPGSRNSAAQVAVNIMVGKMTNDILSGKQPVAPASHALNVELNTQKISRLLGNDAATAAVTAYKDFWTNNSADPVKEVEAQLSRLPDAAKEQAERLKRMQQGHQGLKLQ